MTTINGIEVVHIQISKKAHIWFTKLCKKKGFRSNKVTMNFLIRDWLRIKKENSDFKRELQELGRR